MPPNAPTAARPPAPARRWRLAMLRGIVWSLIGLIYAPLFTGLAAFLRASGWGGTSYALAGALAGGIGAALYGAHELALAATGLGVVIGVAALIAVPEALTFMQVALIAAVLAAIPGALLHFPARCSRFMSGKTAAGLTTGACCGGILALAELLHAREFGMFPVLAFMVSVNGILYVASVRWWIARSRRRHGDTNRCAITDATVMAVLAGLGAGSVWMVAGPLLGQDEALWRTASLLMHDRLPLAILGAMFGGGLAGLLLQAFGFSWVHDV